MFDDDTGATRVRWARLRFSIIGPLLSAPPETGELWPQIEELAKKSWRHPTTAERVRFSPKTIERWLYTARDQQDPIKALERKVPKHAGTFPSINDVVAAEIRGLRRDHPRWTFQLVHDNLVAIADDKPTLLPLPGYASVCRFMRHHGLGKARRPRRHELEPGFVARERRSFEVRHTHALWHCDFHDGSRNVLVGSGEWKKPFLFGVLDDHSRLCCHAQWYLDVSTDSLVHGTSQAIMKRGLPRALLSDNGSAMIAAETAQGLERLSITHETTLPRCPEQNGKQEAFWGVIEGRLMPMLEGEKKLALESPKSGHDPCVGPAHDPPHPLAPRSPAARHSPRRRQDLVARRAAPRAATARRERAGWLRYYGGRILGHRGRGRFAAAHP